MNEIALDARFARRDETNPRTPPTALRHPTAPTTHDVAPPGDLTDLAAQTDAPDAPSPDDPRGTLAKALIASDALDAHVERIVRHILAEYDAQQNVYARRAGGYRPGAFGSIG